MPREHEQKAGIIVGVDFDNTIVSYDALLHRIAASEGLAGPETRPEKRAIRDAVRLLEDGETKWQQLQARIYGPDMGEARLHEGAWTFLQRCRARGIPFFIVSHKTKWSPVDAKRTNLRAAALSWMREHHFFEPDGLGMRADQVFFEDTRAAKLSRIRELGCTHFIDDLEETFAEPAFPAGVARILFSAASPCVTLEGVLRFPDWDGIQRHFLEIFAHDS